MGFFSKLFGWGEKLREAESVQGGEAPVVNMPSEQFNLSEETVRGETSDVGSGNAVFIGAGNDNTLVGSENTPDELKVADVEYEYPTLDEGLEALYRKLMKEYGKCLIDKLKKELEAYIVDNDLLSKATKRTSIQERFELSGEEFDVLFEVILLEHEYNNLSQDLSDLLGFLCEDISNFEVFDSNIQEFKQKQDELKGKISEFLSSHQSLRPAYSCKPGAIVGVNDSNLEEYPELGYNSNFVIYLSNVDGEIARTMNSNSGKGMQAMGAVANKILTLCQADYDSLRSKGEIHQIQVQGSRMNGQMLTDFNLAFERLGASCTTKVGYIRISLNRKNLELLRTTYKNNNLKYIILVIAFGDFRNTDGSERNLFAHFSSVAKECEEEIGKIIRLFSEGFTLGDFEVANVMIQQGVYTTKKLKDDPEVLLECSSNMKKVS